MRVLFGGGAAATVTVMRPLGGDGGDSLPGEGDGCDWISSSSSSMAGDQRI